MFFCLTHLSGASTVSLCKVLNILCLNLILPNIYQTKYASLYCVVSLCSVYIIFITSNTSCWQQTALTSEAFLVVVFN